MRAAGLPFKPILLCFLVAGLGLGACGEGEKLPDVGKLIAQLQSDEPAARKQAAVLLEKHGPRAASAVAALLDAADRTITPSGQRAQPARPKGKEEKPQAVDDAQLYDAVVKALSRTGAAGIPGLIDGLERPGQRSAWAAMTALSWIGKPSVKPLVQALGGDKDQTRGLAVTALAGIGKAAAESVPALMEVARGRYGSASGQALVALGRMGGAAVPGLLELLDDPKMGPRRAEVITAIGRLGAAAKPAVPSLLTVLEENDQKIRMATVLALGEIGPAAEAAIPKLMRLEKDDRTQIARGAEKALDQIAPDR